MLFRKFVSNSYFFYLPSIILILAIIYDPSIQPSFTSYSIFILIILFGIILQKKIINLNNELSILIDMIPVVTFIKDTKGKYIVGNKKFKKMLEMENSHLYTSFNAHRDEEQEMIKNKEVIVTEEKINLYGTGESWYQVMKFPVCDKKGELDKIVVFCREIENEKNIEEQKNTFISTIIHDLKNPVLSQLRVLELLIKGKFGAISDMQKEIMEQMQISTKFELDMIMSVLDTYKYDDGKVKFNFEEINFVKMTKNIAAEFKNLLDNQENLILNIENSDDFTNVKADKMHIRRVIYNIMSNAIRHRKEKTPIRIFLSKNENNLEFRVSNYGYHIPEDELANLFNKYGAKTTKFKTVSTGLGLYLSKQIITAHDGKMIAESTPEGLNTFGFILHLSYSS